MVMCVSRVLGRASGERGLCSPVLGQAAPGPFSKFSERWEGERMEASIFFFFLGGGDHEEIV